MPNTRRMQMASAGTGGAGFFDVSGNLWGSGRGEKILGDNTYTDKSSPVQIKADVTNWAEVYPMTDGTVGITATGDIYTWGSGKSSTRAGAVSSPVLISGEAGSGGWSALSANGDSWSAIKDGKLYSCGKNTFGSLGLGDTTNRSSPIQVGSLTDWASLGASDRSIFAIKTDGTLWSWGYNSYGRLGHGDSTNRSSPVQVGSLTNWLSVGQSEYCPTFLKTDGTLWSVGEGSYGSNGQGNTTTYSSPVQVGSATNWTKVGGCNQVTMAINSSNELWVCGRNDDGQLGLNISTSTNKSTLTQISGAWKDFFALQASVLAVKTDGTLWAWGNNGQGRLGLGDTTNRSAPVQVGSLTSWIAGAGMGAKGDAAFYLR